MAASASVLTLSGGGIAATLSPASPDGVFLVQAPSIPTEDFSATPSVTQYPVTVSQTGGAAGASAKRATASVDGVAHARLGGDPETLWETPQAAFARMRDIVASVHGRPADPRFTTGVRRPRAAVGDQRIFHILASSIGNSNKACQFPHPGFVCFADITATLAAQGAHGNVWVDNVSLQTSGEFTVPGEFQTVANNFDTYYAGESATFGSAFTSQNIDFTPQCDANGNKLTTPDEVVDSMGTTGDTAGGRIDIVVTDLLSSLGEGGFFFSGNYFPQAALNCQPAPHQISNETPIVVITGNNYPTGPNLPKFNESYWLNTDVPRSLSHELQHLLHFVNKVLKPVIANGTPVQDEPFIDEGCSMLAEDLFANGVALDTPRFSYSFLLEPNLFALTSFTGFQPNPTSTATNPPYGFFTNTAGSYGLSYLFMRYLYDRFGGNDALARLYASHTVHVGPILAAANNETFEQLYAEFALAVSSQTSGTAVTSDPRFRFGPEITLRGPVDVPSRRSAPFGVRHLVFGGPQTPETFDANNVPNGFVVLKPGVSVPMTVIAGATLYFPLNGTAAGATLRATSVLPNLQGGIVQGQIPNPQPTSF
ncbi:MAG: hypothetical protein ABR591_01535 [Candidatus Velthaea sp.]